MRGKASWSRTASSHSPKDAPHFAAHVRLLRPSVLALGLVRHPWLLPTPGSHSTPTLAWQWELSLDGQRSLPGRARANCSCCKLRLCE